MDAQPRGHTIDGTPWEEPRPPHLPDRLVAVNPWVLPFLVVVAFQLWVFSLDQPRATDAGTVIQYWFDTRFRLTGLLGSLLGLALFVRHPDARSTLPQVASGAFLLLLAHVMGLLELTLDPLFVALAPPSDELSFFSPLRQAYSIFTSLVGVFGIAFIASGLSAARRYEDARPTRRLAAVLAILAVVSSGLSILGLTILEFDVSPIIVGTIIGRLLVNLFEALAVAYLFVVSLTGWLAQEEPRSGWRVAAVGGGLLLLHALLPPFFGVLPPTEGVLPAVFVFMANSALLGWALLVIAFALGLPATESIPDEEPAGATPDRPAGMTPGSGGG